MSNQITQTNCKDMNRNLYSKYIYIIQNIMQQPNSTTYN